MDKLKQLRNARASSRLGIPLNELNEEALNMLHGPYKKLYNSIVTVLRLMTLCEEHGMPLKHVLTIAAKEANPDLKPSQSAYKPPYKVSATSVARKLNTSRQTIYNSLAVVGKDIDHLSDDTTSVEALTALHLQLSQEYRNRVTPVLAKHFPHLMGSRGVGNFVFDDNNLEDAQHD